MNFIKKIINKFKKEYYSCNNIRLGFNFYRSGKISACCYTNENELIIADIFDKNIIKTIENYQNNLIKLHKKGLAPNVCKGCVNFKKEKWKDKINKKLSWIPLNHYKICNLKCVHCSYRKTDDNERDTPHELVLNVLGELHKKNKLEKNCTIAIGGGEPSINKGIEQILNFCIDNNYKALINSNGAKFSELIAKGVNLGLFNLDLTPDAGSREVYARIKGVDCFDLIWSNVEKYVRETEGKANIKFIIEEGNINDVDNMIKCASKAGALHVTLAFDLNIKNEDFEKYRKPVNRFIKLCKDSNIVCTISGFVPKELIEE